MFDRGMSNKNAGRQEAGAVDRAGKHLSFSIFHFPFGKCSSPHDLPLTLAAYFRASLATLRKAFAACDSVAPLR
jgi:hypothetical protein